AVGLLLEGLAADDDAAGADAEKLAHVGADGGLTGGCSHLGNVADLLTVGAVDRQSDNAGVHLLRRRLVGRGTLLRRYGRYRQRQGNAAGCHDWPDHRALLLVIALQRQRLTRRDVPAARRDRAPYCSALLPDIVRSLAAFSSSIVSLMMVAGLKLGGNERGGNSLNVSANWKTSSMMP